MHGHPAAGGERERERAREAKFVSADAGTVTLEVAGERIQLTTGQQAVQVAGLQVSLDSVTGDTVSFQVAR